MNKGGKYEVKYLKVNPCVMYLKLFLGDLCRETGEDVGEKVERREEETVKKKKGKEMVKRREGEMGKKERGRDEE